MNVMDSISRLSPSQRREIADELKLLTGDVQLVHQKQGAERATRTLTRAARRFIEDVIEGLEEA